MPRICEAFTFQFSIPSDRNPKDLRIFTFHLSIFNFQFSIFEEAKIHAPVSPLFYEMRMVVKIIGFGMF